MEMFFWFLVILGPLVLAHEFGHFILAKLSHIRIEEFGLGYPPRLLRLAKIGETEYTLNALPLGGFVRLAGEEDPTLPDSFASKSWYARAGTLIAGPAMNLILAGLLLAFLFSWSGVPKPLHGQGVIINTVIQGSPAAEAGLQTGDTILQIDGRYLEDTTDLQTYIRAHANQEVQMIVSRDGQILPTPIALTPRVNPPENEGPLGIGISMPTETVRYPWYQSIPLGFQYAFQIATLMIDQLSKMIRGMVAPDLAGPIGIASLTQQAAQTGADSLIYLAALLSVNLAFINLLPFPALDGGRLLFIFIEVLRGGRRVDPAKERFVHLVGMVFLLSLMLVISFFDVQRLVGGQLGLP
jgi:regulator of sigma E protease